MSETMIAPNGVDLSKLSLKSVTFHEDMSEETPCFSGVLLEDGVVVANVRNHGQGGCNDYDTYGISKNLNKVSERYGQLQVDCHIMQLAEEWNVATKHQSKGLVLSKGMNVSVVSFGNKTPIAKLKTLQKDYPTWIKNQVAKYEAQGYRVLNRNL
jgi:hypothetical protein